MMKKSSVKMDLAKRKDDALSNEAELFGIITNAFENNHHLNSTNEFETKTFLANSDSSMIKQTEAFLTRTRMLQ